ncbi:MAG TPA: galactokinase family protein [Acidimicrobiia bacterium]|nr:galactokinase family protein [Acidimicrobiia bacterium]
MRPDHDPRRAAIRAAIGAGPVRFHRAPGRVNLLGGHVDYHEGWVVAMAIDHDVLVGARVRTDGRVVVRSLDLPGTVDVAADGTDEPSTVTPAWGRLVGGVVRELARQGRPAVGLDAVVATNLAIGGGLSSSAAFEVATALALGDVAGNPVPITDLALALQRAERTATGVPCGVQDQLVSLGGVAGHALLVDCRTLVATPVPIPESAAVLVVHSGVPRALAGSPWAQRRAESEAVAARLGLPVLRDATPAQVESDPRGRHVVAEMRRAREFADALGRGALRDAGALMLASHRSLRDDMEVSIPELDTLVELFVDAGAFGARLTGGGFGGCVVALAPRDDATGIANDVTREYGARTGRHATSWAMDAAAGAGLEGPAGDG